MEDKANCQCYEKPRRELLNSLNAILLIDFSSVSSELLIVILILYGIERLRPYAIVGLIVATLGFINATKQF